MYCAANALATSAASCGDALVAVMEMKSVCLAAVAVIMPARARAFWGELSAVLTASATSGLVTISALVLSSRCTSQYSKTRVPKSALSRELVSRTMEAVVR